MFQRLDTSNFALKVLTLSMATSTVLLQFTSTALLSDIKKSNIQVSHYDSNISYAVEGGGDLFAPGNRASDAAYLRTNPTAYPAFAEYSEESSIDEQSGVSETGPSMRAFLPFQGEASRGTIVEYTGTTTVFDTRVVCMRPSLSNLSMPNAGTIRGIFQTHWTVPQFNDTLQSQGPVPFSYNFGSDFPVLVTHEWPLFVCFLDPTSDGPISPLYRSFQPAQFVYNFNIVINISEFLAEHASDKYSNYPIRIKDLEEDNEWVVIHTVDNYTSLSLTMCYSSSVAKNMYMTASRSGDYTSEPLPKWNSTLHSYDTSAVRNQLGAARIASQADRGIFNLELQTSFDAASLAENTSSIPFTALAELNPTKGNPFPDTNPSTLTIAMCRCCLGDADRFANHLHVAVFNDIVRDTRHPALALQSLYTTLFGMTYYDRLDQYNISAQATTVQKVEIQCPVTHTFYYIVLAFYILHLALVGLIAALFCIRCRQSLLGNFWSAAAQLWSPDTEIWLRQADTADGGTVRKWMKAAREAKIRVRINLALLDYPSRSVRVLATGKFHSCWVTL
jgi:hypothetical protein